MTKIITVKYECDSCGQLFWEKDKKAYIAHLKKHIKDKQIIKKMLKSDYDYNKTFSKLHSLVNSNMTDIGDFVTKVKSLDVVNLKGLYVGNLKYVEDRLDDFEQLNNCSATVNRIELKKANGKFYFVIRVDFDIKYIAIHMTEKLKNYSKYDLEVYHPFRAHSWSSSSNYYYNRIVMKFCIGDACNHPYLEKVFVSKLVKSKLKSSSKKFSKNTYRLDTQ